MLLYTLVIQWVHILIAMAQRSARQQFSQLPLVLSHILPSPAVTHEVQKHHLVCHGSSATVCMPRTQIKILRVCCDLQLLEWSGSPSVCLLGSSRNSREDLQIWALALSKRKGRKLRLVSPSALFLSLFPHSLMDFLLSLWLLLLQDFAFRVLSSHSAHKMFRTLAPCISSLDKIPWNPGKQPRAVTISDDPSCFCALSVVYIDPDRQHLNLRSQSQTLPSFNCCSAPDWEGGLPICQ